MAENANRRCWLLVIEWASENDEEGLLNKFEFRQKRRKSFFFPENGIFSLNVFLLHSLTPHAQANIWWWLYPGSSLEVSLDAFTNTLTRTLHTHTHIHTHAAALMLHNRNDVWNLWRWAIQSWYNSDLIELD